MTYLFRNSGGGASERTGSACEEGTETIKTILSMLGKLGPSGLQELGKNRNYIW